MITYMKVSNKISEVALNYVPHEDFHQYSIDEFFMDITESYHLFANTPKEFAELLQYEIYQNTDIKSTIGIGSNMFLAKVSMDIEAKKTNDAIFDWRYEDIPCKLWKIDKLPDIWGINKRTDQKLNKSGIYTVGQLVQYPYEYLKRDFRLIGIELHLRTNEINESSIKTRQD